MSTQQLPRHDAVRFRKNKKPKGFQVYGLQIHGYKIPNKEYIALIIQYCSTERWILEEFMARLSLETKSFFTKSIEYTY